MSNHVLPLLRRNPRTRVSSFAERLLGLADDAAAVREGAFRTQSAALVLKAAAVERDVLDTLMGRLGIDSAAVAAGLAEAEALGRALLLASQECPEWPAVAAHLIPELERHGARELADALRESLEQRPALAVVPSPQMEIAR